MLKPLLMIGVGGSGGKTLRSMKQALNRRFLSAGYHEGIPDAWQFLQIDTTYDGVTFTSAPMMPRDEVHLVVPQGATFQSVKTSLTSKGTLQEQQTMLAGWGIFSTGVSIGDGAGMIRGIGRQVGVADSPRVLSALSSSIAKLKAPAAIAQLRAVARKLDAEQDISTTPQAFIISSLAGGSGAGMFFDVAELLKRATSDNWVHESISLLYTSDVFASLGNAGKDVSKNALGAMNELIASKWVSLSDRSDLLYQKLGVVASASHKSGYGCAGNILIGASNKTGTDISKGADGVGMDEVFLTIGEALAGAFTDDSLSEWLFQTALVNIIQTEAAIDLSGLAPEGAANKTFTAAGIGFGQLSVGTDRIVEYVADALTYKQVEKLLWPELTASLLKAGVTNTTLVQERTDELWPRFLVESGLDERGKQNQIVDALYPQDWDRSNAQFAQSLTRETLTEKEVQLSRYANSLWNKWEENKEEHLNALEKQINKNAERWVLDIQDKFRNKVAELITEDGYSVAISLILKLQEELRDHVLQELKLEHNDAAKMLSTFDKSTFLNRVNSNAEGLTGVTSTNKQFLDKMRMDLFNVLDVQVKSYVSSLAASLVEDLLKMFLEPILKTLDSKRYELRSQRNNDTLPDGSKNRLDTFPKWGSGRMPDQYKPRTIERILVEMSDYEGMFEMYAGRDSGGTPPFPLAVRSSLLGIKMNPGPGEENVQSLVGVATPWTTGVRAAQGQMGALDTKVDWKINTGLLDLAERNRRWLKNRETSFGKFTDITINEFVEDPNVDAKERSKREEKFVNEFTAMIALAQPLIKLNPSAMNHVISVGNGSPADGILLYPTKIPFSANSSIGQNCTLVLQGMGQNVQTPNFAQRWFKETSRAKVLYTAATTQASLPAWAFESLTDPILIQVEGAKNEGKLWNQFWSHRRTRPLTEAVPFETEMRRSIITGWFLASLFGLREIETTPAGKRVVIWNPTLQTPGWSEFPNPLLNTHAEDMSRETWVLPSLLMSAGISLSMFGKTGNAENIHGYQLLKFLGREVTTSIRGRDKWDGNGLGDKLPTQQVAKSTYLKNWIETGGRPAETRPLLELLETCLTANPDRKQALVATLQTLQNQYAEAWSQFANVGWHLIPETWELKDDIDLALTDIQNYVTGMLTVSAKTSA